MAERFPLVFNKGSGRIEELPIGDNIDLSANDFKAGIVTAVILSNPNFISTSLTLNDSSANYAHIGPISVSVGATITVGAGVSYVVI